MAREETKEAFYMDIFMEKVDKWLTDNNVTKVSDAIKIMKNYESKPNYQDRYKYMGDDRFHAQFLLKTKIFNRQEITQYLAYVMCLLCVCHVSIYCIYFVYISYIFRMYLFVF